MDSTKNTPQAPVGAVDHHKSTIVRLVVAIVLLGLGMMFWKWSMDYRYRHTPMMHYDRNMERSIPAMSDADMDQELNASLNTSSEVELKEIDTSF